MTFTLLSTNYEGGCGIKCVRSLVSQLRRWTGDAIYTCVHHLLIKCSKMYSLCQLVNPFVSNISAALSLSSHGVGRPEEEACDRTRVFQWGSFRAATAWQVSDTETLLLKIYTWFKNTQYVEIFYLRYSYLSLIAGLVKMLYLYSEPFSKRTFSFAFLLKLNSYILNQITLWQAEIFLCVSL